MNHTIFAWHAMQILIRIEYLPIHENWLWDYIESPPAHDKENFAQEEYINSDFDTGNWRLEPKVS